MPAKASDIRLPAEKKHFAKKKKPVSKKTGNGQYLSFAGMFFKTGQEVSFKATIYA